MADPLIDDINLPGGSEEFPSPSQTGSQSLHRVAVDRPPTAESEQHRIQRIQAAALIILAAGTVLSLIYVAKLILIVILTSILMAFVLTPVVDALSNFRVPR